ncbi:hypothetical protein AURDEDRAFT_176491 [Auricularia subglabra TFB-10046 SS5]|nr:hypothetical protein AURDEDRAFT_176491 [Auricularia subglabra TFB-10046 SS5]
MPRVPPNSAAPSSTPHGSNSYISELWLNHLQVFAGAYVLLSAGGRSAPFIDG